MLQLYISAFCVTVAFGVQAFRISTVLKRKKKCVCRLTGPRRRPGSLRLCAWRPLAARRYHHTVRLIVWSINIATLGYMFALIHFSRYSINGIGIGWMREAAYYFQSGAEARAGLSAVD